jgi:N-acetyltransferase 10
MQRKFANEMQDENQLNQGKDFTPLKQTMDEELDEEAKKLEKKQRKELIKLKKESLAQYAIKGTDDDWAKALTAGKKSIVSVKSGEKRGAETIDQEEAQDEDRPGWNKNKKKKFQGQENFQAKRGKKDKFFKK